MANEKTSRFISRFREHRIVFKPSYTNEVHGRVITHPGESIRFAEGMYETSDEDIVNFLRSQPDFGRTFYEVPANVKDLVGHRETALMSLEEREAAVAARERAVQEQEARVGSGEEGARVSKPQGEKTDDLDSMNRAALVVVAESLELPKEAYKVGTTNESIKNAIRAKRAETAPAAPEKTGEGDNAAF